MSLALGTSLNKKNRKLSRNQVVKAPPPDFRNYFCGCWVVLLFFLDLLCVLFFFGGIGVLGSRVVFFWVFWWFWLICVLLFWAFCLVRLWFLDSSTWPRDPES